MRRGECSIYEDRPELCRDWPWFGCYLPDGCTFSFEDGVRQGECDSSSCGENCCCAIPRKGGKPGGVALREEHGGAPCKHLRWEEIEKTASVAKEVVSRGVESMVGYAKESP